MSQKLKLEWSIILDLNKTKAYNIQQYSIDKKNIANRIKYILSVIKKKNLNNFR